VSKHQTQGGPDRPVDKGQRVRRINPRALILIVLALVVSIPAVLGAKALQDSRRRAGLLREARERFEDGRPDYALKFVNEYLRLRPNDPEALDFRGQLLAETARDFSHIEQATQVIEQVLRLDPNGPDRQETRRRLVRLYLDMERFVHPDLIPYQIAERVANELIERAEADGPEPEDYRLLGRVYEGQARRVEGQIAESLLRNTPCGGNPMTWKGPNVWPTSTGDSTSRRPRTRC
jgi:tetratricopeptide (TPR) repeat protein